MKQFKLTGRTTLKRILYGVLLLVVLGAGVWLLTANNSRSRACLSIASYTDEFAAKYAKSSGGDISDVKNILKETSDSVAYRNMRTFARKMFQNGDQTLAFEYLKNCMSLLEQHPDNSKAGLDFKTHCYLLLGAAADDYPPRISRPSLSAK